jgi:hypothetical protein
MFPVRGKPTCGVIFAQICSSLRILATFGFIKDGVRRADETPSILCYVIGDIERQVEKLKHIRRFTDENSGSSFVFLGDIFNDISATSTGNVARTPSLVSASLNLCL